MPVIRSIKRSASPVEFYSSNPFDAPFPATSASILHVPPPPVAPESDASQTKKKRSHGKARPAGHIPRPPNAFIIFRTDYIKSMDTHSTPEVSKNLGKLWKSMTRSEQQPWIDKAEEAKARHREQYPDYRYKPIHPRDADGKCIRKPRRPNQPRVKTALDMLERTPAVPLPWFDEKAEGEFPSIALTSDTSSASSPPRSPTPISEYYFPRPLYQGYRRSSSVPIPGTDRDDRNCFAPEPQSAYPSSAEPHTGHMSRRLSKRPSTSMDFTCSGPNTSELYSPTNAAYLAVGDNAHWRFNHRRSISAPDFGPQGPPAHVAYAPSQSLAQQADVLTPINPVFGEVFNNFSWAASTDPQQAFSNEPSTMPPYISIDIPPMSHSPTSNFSSATVGTPPTTTPASASPRPVIQHPVPVATFDFSAFQSQLNNFNVEQDAQNHSDHALDPAHHGQQQLYANDSQVGGPQQQQFYASDNSVHYASNAHSTAYPAVDLQSYEERTRYTRAEIVPPQPLEFDELIVESY